MATGQCRLALPYLSRLCAASTVFGILSAAPVAAQPQPAAPSAAAGQDEKKESAAAPQALSVLRPELPPISLAECLRIANERQPALAAARASLAAREAAHAGIAALNPPLQRITAPDLCIRREQSLRGISAAQADLFQAEYDTAYAVIRMYYTAVYSQRQFAVADDVTKRIEDKNALIKEGLGKGARIAPEVVGRVALYMRLARIQRNEAQIGFDRALAALREAMGVGVDGACFRPADLDLPELTVVPCSDQIVALALQRRGEIVQAVVAADVTRLEVDAQGRFCFKPLVRTFASSSDIHAKALPTAMHNGHYKPGAVGIEFPGNLAGSKPYRVAQASAYADRMAAVVEKTRGLVTLEAEEHFQRWREATDAVREAKVAAEDGIKLAEETENASGGGNATGVKEDEAVKDFVLAGQARAALNKSLYEQILALANLERITAGGFCAGFPVSPAPAVVVPPPAAPIDAPPTALPEPKVPSIDSKRE